MNSRYRYNLLAQCGLALIIMGASLVHPLAVADVPPPPALSASGDLDAFFSTFVTEGLATHTLPGVTVAVVADGELVFARGYGYADIARGIPADPETTLFDVGSVAKLFTFTAVMQLVEQGRLDLHADVNRYLTHFRVPATFPEPVMAAHLLTHTGGFDEWDIGAAARTADEVLPVCAYLAERLPPRVRPPGELIAYSNHGTALAGCLVEEISGLPFAEYVERHIFAPLGMTRSTFAWPPALMADMAVGYQQRNGTLEPVAPYYRHFGPAGELKTTATDIARFMVAHLQAGSCEGARILQPETARLMHARQFTHHPLLPGFTYGFFEDTFNGWRALIHGGDTNPSFSSLLVLLPEENVGLFVAHNTAEYAFREALVRAFMDRYFPASSTAPAPQPMPDHAARARRFAGWYAPTFMVRETSLEKLLTLFARFRITADAAGVLTLHEPVQLPGDGPLRWVEVEPLTFRSLEGAEILVFVADDVGGIAYMATSRYPAAAFLPVPWHAAAGLHLALLIVNALLFFSAIVAGVRRRGATLFHRLPALIGGLNLLFIIGLAVMLQILAFDAIFGLPLWARGLLILPVLTAALLPVALVGVAAAWQMGVGSLAGRLHDSLILIAALAFIWQVFFWNLTAFHL